MSEEGEDAGAVVPTERVMPDLGEGLDKIKAMVEKVQNSDTSGTFKVSSIWQVARGQRTH